MLKVLWPYIDDNLALLRPKAYPAHSGTLTAGLLASSLDAVSPQAARDQGWQTHATRSAGLGPAHGAAVTTIATISLVEAFGDELAPFVSQAGSIALASDHPIAIDCVLKGLV
jgi:hypothetical protein